MLVAVLLALVAAAAGAVLYLRHRFLAANAQTRLQHPPLGACTVDRLCARRGAFLSPTIVIFIHC